MIRRTPLKRSTKPIPKRRAKPRRGPMRDPEYRAFLSIDGSCVACCMKLRVMGWRDPIRLPTELCDPCHTENGGMRMKGPDSSCAPLCRVHHDEYDGRRKLPNGEVGRLAFEAYYGVDMKAVAKAWWDLYNGKSAEIKITAKPEFS